MKKKNYYYVLVFANDGAKYVTGLGAHHTAYWDGTKPPMAFNKESAQSIVTGLNLNFNLSAMVASEWELTVQPYCYDKGEFTWTWDEDKG